MLSEESCLICFQKSASYHFGCFNWEMHYNFVQLNTISAFICPYRKLSLYLGIIYRRRHQNYTLPWEVRFTKFKTALQKRKIHVLVHTPQIMELGKCWVQLCLWFINPGETTIYHFAVLEDYELSERRSPGETTLSDMHAVLARRKDMCDKMVLKFFSVLI